MRILLLALLLALAAPAHAQADLVLVNARVYTANDAQPEAQAMAIREGRIVAVGTNDAIKRIPAARVVDLKGATVVPGFTDAHAHLVMIGERETAFNLAGVTSLDELKRRLAERAASTPKGQWIVGQGWIETHWKPPAFPTRWDLDTAAPDHPVILSRADGHAVVVNTRALRIADITRATEDPEGGRILKRSDGEPTGMLIDTAERLVLPHVPEPTPEDVERFVLAGAQRSVALGWTQIQDAGSDLRTAALYERLYQEGRLKLRIYQAVRGPESIEATLEAGPRTGLYDHRYSLRAIKILVDGALGSRGAALLAPYQDAPDTSGLLRIEKATLLPLLTRALRAGIQVEAHAIGDRGNRETLDLFEEAFKAVPEAKDPRWRIEHVQVVDPADIPRFARLGVIPSMQTSHAISDMFFAPARLGPERVKGAYAWRSFRDAGSIIAGGSDAPVEVGDPMIELYAAVARKPLPGGPQPRDDWHPEQALTRAEALKALTIWPAYAAFEEHLRGTLEPGKLADLVVLSQDIMTVPVDAIPKTRIEATIINGEIVFARAGIIEREEDRR